MSAEAASKVTSAHLARSAYLYVRQSTLRQVLTNTESTARQYQLRQRAIALGWPAEQVITIDTDQGQSGASAADREGFQRLVAEAGMGRAGIVLGLEVSRLARNSADWHRLLEICALTGTLLCDEEGLYVPGAFKDRLLLGLKGAMSEAELHFIRARLIGGQLSAARRGELRMPLPVGLVYDGAGQVVLDPDSGVRDAVGHVFALFARSGSARAVVQEFNAAGLLFPARIRAGARKGELAWMPLTHWRVLRTLHNPRYAGAFAYGRRRGTKSASGKNSCKELPRDQWTVLIPGAHPGYITWEQYEASQKQLLANATARGADRTAGPAREGAALLQGLAVCGKCGRRMTVRYHTRRGAEIPDYQCMRDCIDKRRAPLPDHPRRRRRHRHRRPAARRPHPAHPGGRPHRAGRNRNPRRRSRHATPPARPASRAARRPGPPPLPGRRPGQPARRRQPRSRLERRAARPASRSGRLRQGQLGRDGRAHRGEQGPHPVTGRRLPRALVRPGHPPARAQAHGPAHDRGDRKSVV